jgi:hypothetical protein
MLHSLAGVRESRFLPRQVINGSHRSLQSPNWFRISSNAFSFAILDFTKSFLSLACFRLEDIDHY